MYLATHCSDNVSYATHPERNGLQLQNSKGGAHDRSRTPSVPQYDLTVRKAFGTSAIRPEGTHPRRVDHAGDSTLYMFAVGNVMSEELMLRC